MAEDSELRRELLRRIDCDQAARAAGAFAAVDADNTEFLKAAIEDVRAR